ncbi:hypothetical protein BBBOND_0207430 [Babesia bigemina]|uniref:Uncharacterized protein n=1 Tax=Babesia bigemina TaxID=5866 RepID=A0A061D4U2_BABBI|nr:hypothetical protein BBBOND_0207430 [Babesia bigemina]CDR95588.1 hypothetical protein BBBOND_0207430 [Babesia bigemina]|eukprot:XP_012767774.1 hypothetical protein BBBOND_0207430 [Babesia bigemina]
MRGLRNNSHVILIVNSVSAVFVIIFENARHSLGLSGSENARLYSQGRTTAKVVPIDANPQLLQRRHRVKIRGIKVISYAVAWERKVTKAHNEHRRDLIKWDRMEAQI